MSFTKINLIIGSLALLCTTSTIAPAQSLFNLAEPQSTVSKVWAPDLGNGQYKNPVLYADYSDPDAIRVGEDYFLVSSSFNCVPALPILHSKDLVNWTIIGNVFLHQAPFDVFNKPQHGNGVWAPALRYHKGEFYLFYPDPDYGIYVCKAKNPQGPWSEPIMVKAGKGLIDPCPLWDDDGSVYLVHGYAGSRATIKSVLTINKMNAEATAISDQAVMVFDGHTNHPTLEGPKLYKRNGYYYIFAPAGGVKTGWQLVLRSKNIYGPYEEKIVMDQGKSSINGPHQGAWVDTQTGEDWFLHFNDKEAYGRVVMLQPMQWKADWPVIGVDKDGDGKGEPVLEYKKPNVGGKHAFCTPQSDDEFSQTSLGLQWQWHANPQFVWGFPSAQGFYRLNAMAYPEGASNLWAVPNLLMQKLVAPSFSATTKFNFSARSDSEKFGFLLMGSSYAYISVERRNNQLYISQSTCLNAEKGNAEEVSDSVKVDTGHLFFKIDVKPDAVCRFSYSTDGKKYREVGKAFSAVPGRWIGAKIGYFCLRKGKFNDSGYSDIDWFRLDRND